MALGVLAVGLSDAPAGVGYWILAATVVSGVMATIVLTTKVAHTAATSDSTVATGDSTSATSDSNVTPLRRTIG
jgi:hypothetical protein